jgi:hydroxyacylglutathione hydrolase
MNLNMVALVDTGLGNSSYLLDLGDGRGLVVDAGLDLRAVRAEAERRHLRIAYAADTHLHADFVTGAVQLAADDGATVLASSVGGRDYPHRGLSDGEEVDLGGLTLRTLFTPGHTQEHVAFELREGARTLGVFTGGSLLVGAAARTDLVSPDLTEQLARAQYWSLQRIAGLDDAVAVWPTHGAESFCSAPPGAERTSTIGTERATNAFLRAAGEDEFVARLLGSLGSFPPYFRTLAEVNRRGPALVDGDTLPGVSQVDLGRLVAAGAEVVDVRPVVDFAAGHVPGSLSIALRPVFGTWLGWLVGSDRPLVIVRNADQDVAEVVWQARKVGYNRLLGELDGGIRAWTGAGRPVGRIPLVAAGSVDAARVLDVRQSDEYAAAHVPGATHVELGRLAEQAHRLPRRPTVVMCGHGERAMGAASLLLRAGHRDVAVLDGGPDDWAASSGRALETGA